MAEATKTDTVTADATQTATAATDKSGSDGAGKGDKVAAVAVTTTTKTAQTTDKGATPDAKGYWPDDWQRRLAGDDEKALKQVTRYASPEDIWKKARSLEQRLSSGEFKTALPKDAKPEELAAWRKDNGIPEKPEAYDLKGLDIPKEDKDIVEGFLKAAHGAHFTPEQAKVAVQGYYAEVTRQEQARTAKDEEQRTNALDALNQEWGGSFRRNVNLVEGLLAKFPEKVRESLKHARLPDGTALFNSPDAVRGFAALALELNPAGIIAPAGGGDLGKTMLDEYNSIQTMKSKDRKAYNKDSAIQERERDLIDAMVKQGLMDSNGNLKRKAA